MLALLSQDSKLTAKTLASTLGLTDWQVERILSKLKADGKIIRHGANKNGYWEVKKFLNYSWSKEKNNPTISVNNKEKAFLDRKLRKGRIIRLWRNSNIRSRTK